MAAVPTRSRLGPLRRLVGHPMLRAFFASPSGAIGLTFIVLIALVALIAPETLHNRATTFNFALVTKGPSWSHPLGTDQLGRDILARLLVATRLSVGLALATAGIALVLGVSIGSSAALIKPRWRPVLLRAIDTMLSFPVILTAIFITVISSPGTRGALLGVGIALSFSLARVSSTLALSVGGREYISAARVLGVRGPRLMLRYVLPNIAEPLIVAVSVIVGVSIVAVSALSYLGLGVQQPQFDWGGMLTDGVKSIYETPAAALGPAGAIALTAIAFGFTGEALARATNPLLWTRSRAPRRGPTSGASVEPARAADPPPGASNRASAEEFALEVRDLVVSFPGPNGPIEVVKGVSFAIPAGEFVGIVGESGSGKTMTALAIARLTPYPGRVSGTIKIHGNELERMHRRELDRLLGTEVAVVFQDPLSSLNPALRVGKQLIETPRVYGELGRKEATKLAIESLREVHIPAAERQISRYPHEFSGGMRQRAMIAMGLMKEPTLLLADEPTTALDVTIQAQIMDLLHEVNSRHRTAIVLISHNLALISQNCDRIFVMYAGRIVEELDAEQLRRDPKHPYTRALLRAVPEGSHSRDQPLEYIRGEAPDLASPPPGCPYHPRCPLAVARCSAERPELLPSADGRRVACHVVNDELAA